MSGHIRFDAAMLTITQEEETWIVLVDEIAQVQRMDGGLTMKIILRCEGYAYVPRTNFNTIESAILTARKTGYCHVKNSRKPLKESNHGESQSPK